MFTKFMSGSSSSFGIRIVYNSAILFQEHCFACFHYLSAQPRWSASASFSHICLDFRSSYPLVSSTRRTHPICRIRRCLWHVGRDKQCSGTSWRQAYIQIYGHRSSYDAAFIAEWLPQAHEQSVKLTFLCPVTLAATNSDSSHSLILDAFDPVWSKHFPEGHQEMEIYLESYKVLVKCLLCLQFVHQ